MASNGVMDEPIRFDAEVRQIKTMVDRSFNITLNIPEYNVEQVQEMMTMLGDMVAVAMVKADGFEDDYE